MVEDCSYGMSGRTGCVFASYVRWRYRGSTPCRETQICNPHLHSASVVYGYCLVKGGENENLEKKKRKKMTSEKKKDHL